MSREGSEFQRLEEKRVVTLAVKSWGKFSS
jgi:hypothetical protein